jgi:hypothetical protein
MSVSIVNGYVCTSCNDVAKAKRGENPAQANGPEQGPTGRLPKGDEVRRASEGPAVVLGGSLSARVRDPGDGGNVASAPGEVSRRLDIRA